MLSILIACVATWVDRVCLCVNIGREGWVTFLKHLQQRERVDEVDAAVSLQPLTTVQVASGLGRGCRHDRQTYHVVWVEHVLDRLHPREIGTFVAVHVAHASKRRRDSDAYVVTVSSLVVARARGPLVAVDERVFDTVVCYEPILQNEAEGDEDDL